MVSKKKTDAIGRTGKNVNISVEVHKRLADYCDRRGQIQGVIATRALAWLLAQPKAVRDVIVEAEEVVESEARGAYCTMLRQMAAEVCGEVNGGSGVVPYADTTPATESRPGSAPGQVRPQRKQLAPQ